ncbi:MAG: elongator complex protein 3 [Desulforhopalus sp.]
MSSTVLVIPVFIPHRGCPHDCLFCNQQKISGCSREREGGIAVGEIINRWLTRKHHRKQVQVAFFGGSFTCLPVIQQIGLLSQVQPYMERKQVDTIRLSTRPDCVDNDICELLQRYRVGVVELGAQSFSDRVLAAARRGHSAAQSIEAFRLLKKAGLQVGLQLMLGLPAESSRSLLRTIDTVIGLRPDFVRIYPALVIQDSGLAELYQAKRYRPLSLHKAVALSARCCLKLENAGIKVVRMGLQPSKSLEKNILAGPYHPAFGELVRSRIWLKSLRAEISRIDPRRKVQIYVSPRDVSAVVGANRSNIKKLEQLGFEDRFSVKVDKSMEQGNIRYVVC